MDCVLWVVVRMVVVASEMCELLLICPPPRGYLGAPMGVEFGALKVCILADQFEIFEILVVGGA